MILCNGEALIDMVPNADGALQPLAGGAVYNTAIALGRLGIPSGFMTGLSTDLFGERLDAGLSQSNVTSDLCIRSDRPTTLAFVKLTDGNAQYTFYDENTAGRMITPDDLPAVADDISTLYFGGISLCSEPAASTYQIMCLRHAAEKVTMIDPNVRASFVTDQDAYIARIRSMVAASDIVKVSDDDLDWLVEGDADIMDKLIALQDLGPKIAILTRGADGPLARLADGRTVAVPVPRVTVKDTVGAGDTFNAGFLAQLHELDCLTKDKIADIALEDLKSALTFGAAVSAVTVSRAGANSPWRSELDF